MVYQGSQVTKAPPVTGEPKSEPQSFFNELICALGLCVRYAHVDVAVISCIPPLSPGMHVQPPFLSLGECDRVFICVCSSEIEEGVWVCVKFAWLSVCVLCVGVRLRLYLRLCV